MKIWSGSQVAWQIAYLTLSPEKVKKGKKWPTSQIPHIM